MDGNNEQPEQSYILLQFSGVGSAVMVNRVFENVTPGQVMIASEVLNVLAKNQFIMEENQRIERERQMAIQVPENKIEIAGK